MNQSDWERRLRDLMKRAGDELKKTGEDLRVEATRLMDEMRDPSTQAKMKESVREISQWAKKTAVEATEMIESLVQKADAALRTPGSTPAAHRPSEEPSAGWVHPSEHDQDSAERDEDAAHDGAEPGAPARAPRSVKPASSKPGGTKPKGGAKKSIGRRKS